MPRPAATVSARTTSPSGVRETCNARALGRRDVRRRVRRVTREVARQPAPSCHTVTTVVDRAGSERLVLGDRRSRLPPRQQSRYLLPERRYPNVKEK